MVIFGIAVALDIVIIFITHRYVVSRLEDYMFYHMGNQRISYGEGHSFRTYDVSDGEARYYYRSIRALQVIMSIILYFYLWAIIDCLGALAYGVFNTEIDGVKLYKILSLLIIPVAFYLSILQIPTVCLIIFMNIKKIFSKDVKYQRMLKRDLKFILVPHGYLGVEQSYNAIREENPIQILPFYLSDTEVTVSQWVEIYKYAVRHGYTFDCRRSERIYYSNKNYPITDKSWCDMIRWCNAASEMAKRDPCYYIDGVIIKGRNIGWLECKWEHNGYRLPTEIEWEYAYRANTKTKYFWGDNYGYRYYLKQHKIPYIATVSICPVASHTANPWGFYDMEGNVSEWCWDIYSEKRNLSPYDKKHSNINNDRVVRGGNENSFENEYEATYRSGRRATIKEGYSNIGFRIACRG